MAELSGMVVEGGALWATGDGGRRVELHRLDPASCAVTDTRTAGIDPFDAEDLARGPQGSLWVGDVGDNEQARATVAVIVLPARGEPRLHRLTYPDGPHDAEALLVDAEGRPVVVTKDAGRAAGVYRTAEPPRGAGPTALQRVGEVALPVSDTVGGPLGGLGSRLVTGAATSEDGRVVALRTYTDAWLYPAPDGDPVAALLAPPVRVPLPGEPQGEAIAFDAGGALLSGSETRGGVPGEIRAVPAAAGLVGSGPSGGADARTGPASPDAAGPSDPGTAPGTAVPDASGGAPPEWATAAIGGAATVALLVLVAAAMALRARLRR